jgi:hypothetical protein
MAGNNAMKPILRAWAGLLLLLGLLPVTPVKAQTSDGLDPAVISFLLTNVFGAHHSFTGVADIQVNEPGMPSTLQIGLCRQGDKYRVFLDFANFQGGAATAPLMRLMRQMGTDKIINIMRLDKGVTWRVYPGVQAYHESTIALQTEGATEETKTSLAAILKSKMDRADAGEETVNGHPCAKKQIRLVNGREQLDIGFLWLARDMKDFPVRIELRNDGTPFVITFKEVRTTNVDARLFEVPAGYQKYKGIAEITAAARARRAAAPRPPAKPAKP